MRGVADYRQDRKAYGTDGRSDERNALVAGQAPRWIVHHPADQSLAGLGPGRAPVLW
ncbi:hypothetical protein BN10_540056 [Phycicoccus elongatus Lp2]|uniref:Uncharacterized protein n=1 Tax=Phycicoccus elongatus Lp2 TaxID=1193181 RepID=N0E0A1_9MICO|nr:hypothetical protein BN10_540056 [Phycicoccus elongatus Lp2]